MGSACLLSSNPIEVGYFNPGALSLTGGFHIYIPMAQVNFNWDFLDMAEFISDNTTSFENFSSMGPVQQLDFINSVNDEVGEKWVGFDLDPMIGLQIGKLSFAAYSVSRAQVRFLTDTTPPYSYPTLSTRAEVDLVFNAAYGMQVGPLLHGGVGLRFLRRQYAEQTIDPLEGDDFQELFKTIADQAEESVSGLALDVGGTVTLTKALAVGGVVRGLISSMEDADWEPELSAGVRLKPLEILMGIPLVFIRDITLEADIQDLANVRGEEYMEKLQLGAEVKIPFFALRAGMNRGKLAYGLGLHALIFDLAVAKASVPVITPTGVEDQDLFSLSIGIGF